MRTKWERNYGGGEYVSLDYDGGWIVLGTASEETTLTPNNARDLALMLESYADTAEGK